MARGLRNASPDALSWTALVFAAAAGIAFYRGGETLVLLGALFVFLNATFDALDGKVAKLSGRASVRGDFLDHVLDRYADVFILGGIALSPYCPLWLGLLALLGVLLTSYMGTQAQAVGMGRQYGGALGRADRLVIVVVVAVLQATLDPTGRNLLLGIDPIRFTFLGWGMVLFAILGHVTAIQRGVATWRRLT